jgi:TPR repeat protein
VAQDYAQAAALYREQATGGHAPTLMRLGFLYRDGRGVPADPVIAQMCLLLAVGLGEGDAFEPSRALAQRLTPKQLKEAQALVAAWLPGRPLPTQSKTGRPRGMW